MPTAKPGTNQKRQDIVAAVAQHLLEDGFRNSGLRSLAKSVGISDRMIMYYFETKEQLIAEALLFVAGNFVDVLETVLPEKSASGPKIVSALVGFSLSEPAQPLMKLWFEIVGLAVRGDEPYRTTANMFIAEWEQWIAGKLPAKSRHRASELLAQVEGEVMLSLLRPES